MGLYSGLPDVKDWVTVLKPYTWLKTLRDNSLTSFKKWKDIQTEDDTVHTSDKFMTKFRLMKKLKGKR